MYFLFMCVHRGYLSKTRTMTTVGLEINRTTTRSRGGVRTGSRSGGTGEVASVTRSVSAGHNDEVRRSLSGRIDRSAAQSNNLY